MAIATALPFIAREFQLDPLAMGGVFSAFYLGYFIMQIPGGILADKYGPKRVVTTSVVGWSAFTALTSLTASLPLLLAIRVVFGLFEGMFPPAASKALANWFPSSELGRANGMKLAATQFAPALAPPLMAFVITNWGWRAAFFALLIPGLVLAPIVWCYLNDRPGNLQNLSLSAAGRPEYAASSENQGRLDLAAIFRLPSILWCSVALFFTNIASSVLLLWLPTYLMEARGFHVTKMGIYASLPFVAGTIGYYVGGHVGDKYFQDNRRVPTVIGLLTSAVFTFLAAVAPSGEFAVAFFVGAALFLSIAASGILSLPLIIVPQAVVGSTLGVVNTIGQIASFVSPLLVGYTLSLTHRNFTVIFFGVVLVFLIAAAAAAQIRQSPRPGALRLGEMR